MWGHRGVAREIAAMLNLPFKGLDDKLIAHDVEESKDGKSLMQADFSIKVDTPACRRFAGLHFSQIQGSASSFWMAARLVRVDSRPINMIVDATNYVMLDLGQPMHAFDTSKLSAQSILVRNAKNKEPITLLDGQTVELASNDCVITDGQKPIALAGIIGSNNSGIEAKAAPISIFLEAANFDPATIRITAARLKKRTESICAF